MYCSKYICNRFDFNVNVDHILITLLAINLSLACIYCTLKFKGTVMSIIKHISSMLTVNFTVVFSDDFNAKFLADNDFLEDFYNNLYTFSLLPAITLFLSE